MSSSTKYATAKVSDIAKIIETVSAATLKRTVETIAVPRHFRLEGEQNEWTAEWIANELRGFGYNVKFQGPYRNVIATLPETAHGDLTLIGAHYDSVPGTPGADDNASAVAAMLECARVIAGLDEPPPVCFAAFNCEEDGLIGSTDFVKNYLPAASFKIKAAHILEMVGYCSHAEGSQNVPPGLPIKVPTVGNFIGILANRDSNSLIDHALERSATYLPGFPVLGLKTYLGVEKYLSVLGRSDHLPFWNAGIPAVMWTDTADFRNPNYHRKTDTPDTLDYDFMRSTTQLVLSCILIG
jgi:Zn-dependent M28 family amino/carboxypeptidase